MKLRYWFKRLPWVWLTEGGKREGREREKGEKKRERHLLICYLNLVWREGREVRKEKREREKKERKKGEIGEGRVWIGIREKG